MENYNTAEVKEWVNAENQFAQNHFDVVKKKYSIASKIKEYDFLSTNGLPEKKGAFYYSKYRIDKARPASLFYRKQLTDSPTQVVDVYKTFKDNNAYITNYYPSSNSKYLAYQVSLNGSDKHIIRFADIDKSENLEDILTDIKFSDVFWNQDIGVFYKKNGNVRVFDKDSTYQLFYHKIGDAQSADKLVFDVTASESSLHFFTKENKLFIIVTNKEETSQDYYVCPTDSEDFKPEKFISNEVTGFHLLNYSDGRIYFSSSKFDWGEIRSFDIKNREDEKVIIPQIYTHLLVDSFFSKDYIICKYKTVGKNYMIIYDKTGKFVRKFDVPYGMDFKICFLDEKTNDLYVTFYSYSISYLNYKLNLLSGKTGPFFSDYSPPKPSLFPFDYFETKTIAYKSRDGEDIPITIVYKKGIKLDGSNPTLLKAYGGFGVVSGPVYDTGLLYFLEKGGVFAYAEVRGGGEKGRNWHLDGMGLKKINTFNDFIDAAEFLINEKYTSPSKLAITGGSQGGLLVGVAMTQRPDLFKVAIPEMGVFDMIKFGQYTIGKYHLDEYGDVKNKKEFEALMAYSPYHNIKEDINYPTTLIITSENDDRVPPMHSYKFAARLQNREAQKNPVYLMTLSNSGHYGKISNYQAYIEEQAMFYNFLLYHLNQ
jgi:prolyl oligopeptidase